MDEKNLAIYYGKNSSDAKKIRCHTKGKNIIGVLLDKESTPEVEREVMDVCIKSFLKRPTTKLRALNVISNFINNIVFLKKIPGNPRGYTASFLFVCSGKANCNASGLGNVLYFADDEFKLFNNANNQDLGIKPSYVLEVDNEFKLNKGLNAFLLCTDELLEQVEPEKIKSLLHQSETPDEWMKNIIDLCENKDVHAMTLILKEKSKRGGLVKLLSLIVPILLLLGFLIWRLG